MEALVLPCTDLVLDHTIYAKALEVLQNPNNADLKKIINLKMGCFHASRIFLAVIGKRFGSAGLHDLIVEAHLSGPESVNQTMCLRNGCRKKKRAAYLPTFQNLKSLQS